MAACGAAYEIMRWAEAKVRPGELKIKLVDKAAMEPLRRGRPGPVGDQHLHGRQRSRRLRAHVSNDLMGITRDDLVYDVGRHVDDSVHNFEEWGLPIWKTDAGGGATTEVQGTACAQGRRQAGALRQVADHDQRRVLQVDRGRGGEEGAGQDRIEERMFIVKPGQRQERPDAHRGGGRASRCATTSIYVYKAKARPARRRGRVNVFRPRSVGEGTGRAWYPVWNAG